MMRHLDLFSGIGGFALGLQRTGGFETVGFCEIDPFCRKVLAKHWPDVPVHDDVRELNGGTVGHIDIITGGYPCQPFSLAGNRAGAEDDRHLWPEMARLVDELRPAWVIGENVFGHISMGLDEVLSDLEALDYTARAFVIPACAVDAPHRRDRIWIIASRDDTDTNSERSHRAPINQQRDTEPANGQECLTGQVCEVLAGFGDAIDRSPEVMAHPNNPQRRRGAERGSSGDGQSQLHGEGGETVADAAGDIRRTSGHERPVTPDGGGADVAHPDNPGCVEQRRTKPARTQQSPVECRGDVMADTCFAEFGRASRAGRGFGQYNEIEEYGGCGRGEENGFWLPEPDVGRVAHGIPQRVDRLKSLGNAVVPAIPEMIGRAILEAR